MCFPAPTRTTPRPWSQGLRLLAAFLTFSLASVAVAQTLTFPAAPAQWWTDGGLLTSAPTHDSGYATVGQLKNTVWTLAKTLDTRFTSQGGCGDELRTIVRTWDRNFPTTASAAPHTPDIVKDGAMLAVANQGQLKNMALTTYRRLKALGLTIALKGRDPTTGAITSVIVDHDTPDTPDTLPWSAGQNSAPALVGQIKYCFSFEAEVFLGGRVIAWNASGPLPVPSGLNNVIKVAAGNGFSLVLKGDGTVVVFGDNLGSTLQVPSGLSDVVDIAVGSGHCLAVTRSGNVVAWGWNESGQTNVPASLTDVIAVAGGYYHSLALKRNGTVVAWGAQNYNTTYYYTAMRADYGQALVLGTAVDVVAIAAGLYHSLAVKSDGSVIAWGASIDPRSSQYSYYSQYTIPPSYVNRFPDNFNRGQVTVPAGLRALDIAATGTLSIAARTDGTLQSWGAPGISLPPNASNVLSFSTSLGGEYGSVGYGTVLLHADGTVSSWRSSGVADTGLPAGIEGAIAVSAGGSHALAIVRPTPAEKRPILTGPAKSTLPVGDSTAGIYYQSTALNGPVTYSATALPPGLTLDTVTGTITGRPTTAGIYQVQVTATNAQGSTTQTVTFDLNALLPVIAPDSLPLAGVQQTYQLDLHVTAVKDNAVTAVRVAGLPQGLVFDASTLRISGTPITVGSFPLTVEADTEVGMQRVIRHLEVSHVTGWGQTSSYSWNQPPPQTLSGTIKIAAGSRHNLALKSDGSVVAWGDNYAGKATVPTGLSNVIAIAAGHLHSLALKADGTVVAWGSNTLGRINVPAGLTGVISIAAGGSHSLALKSDGTVVAWGDNSSVQSNVPATLNSVVAISAGDKHSIALKSDGTVVTWGSNSDGQRTVPADLSNVVAISAGSTHSLALKADGTVVAWGSNTSGQTQVPTGLSGVVSIAAGANHNLALKSDGTVVGWGSNVFGESIAPTDLHSVIAIAAGCSYSSYSLALSSETFVPGRPVWLSPNQTFRSENHQLTGVFYRARMMAGTAVTFTATRLPPGLSIDATTGVVSGTIETFGEWPATLIATDAEGKVSSHSVLFSLIGSLPSIVAQPQTAALLANPYTFLVKTDQLANVTISGLPPGLIWDATSSRITGTPTQTGQFNITLQASSFSGMTSSTSTFNVTNITAWGQSTLPTILTELIDVLAISGSIALKADATVSSWGSNGDGPTVTPGNLNTIVAVAGKYLHNLALKSDGTVIAWGDNYSGQCTVPSGLTSVIAISAGASHSLALKTNGTVVAWGSNSYGQSMVPIDLSGVVAIAAGYYHSLALKSDGTVIAWGDNSDDQCTVPSGLTGVVAIAAGSNHNLALKSDGSVIAWGDNSLGECTVPTSLSGVVAVSASASFSMALKSDGVVRAWGDHYNSKTAVPASLRNVVAVSAGGSHVLALTSASPSWLSPSYSISPPTGDLTGIWYQARISGSISTYAATDLPPGLSLNAQNGEVTGTPAAEGLWTATLTATSPTGSVSREVRFDLRDLTPHIVNQPEGEVWPRPYQFALSLTNTESVSVTGLPPGLSFDAASRSISGRATELGDFPVTVTAANSFRSITSTKVVRVREIAAWGSNTYGQRTVPAGLSGVTAIATGSWHSLALKSDGTVATWGSQHDTAAPTGLSNVIAIAAGSTHSLALKSDGTVVAWGSDTYNGISVPAGLNNVVAISAGSHFSLALKSDGTVESWGLNSSNQSTVPAGLSSVVAIAAGNRHSLALKSDGTVVAWGANDSSQSTVPTALRGVVAISAGVHESLALKSDGSVVAWGSVITIQTTALAGLRNAKSISAGYFHYPVYAYSVVLKNDGTLSTYGRSSSERPIIPTGLSGVVAIAIGETHSLALISSAPQFVSPRQTFGAEIGSDIYYRARVAGGTSITFTATGLPPGLAIDSATGVVSGAPSTQGSWTATVSANETTTGQVVTQEIVFSLSGL